MADEGYGKTFPNDPNAPAKPPAAPAVRTSSAAPAGDDESVPPAPQAAPSRPAKAVFRVSAGEDGRRSVYMMDDKLETTNLGPVTVDDADGLLNALGTFNDVTGAWEVPEPVAKQLVSGDLPVPDYVLAKYRSNKALIARGAIMTEWLSGKAELDDVLARADLETIKMQVKEAPLFVYRGSVAATAGKMWSDLKEAGVSGVARRMTGEAAGLTAFAADAPFLVAGGLTIGASLMVAQAAPGAGQTAAAGAAAALAKGLETTAGGLVFKRSYEIEGGNAAAEMLEKGFQPETVKKYAPVVGVINGALEIVSFRLLAAPFKRVILRNVLTNKAVKKTLASAVVHYVKELGGEMAQEEAQEAVNVIAESMAADADQRPDLKPTGEEILNRGMEIGLKTLAGVGVVKAPGLALEAGMTVADQRAAQAKVAERAQKVKAALQPVSEPAPATPASGEGGAAAQGRPTSEPASAAPKSAETVDPSGDYFPRQEKTSQTVDDLSKAADTTENPTATADQIEAAVAELNAAPQNYGEKVIEVERKGIIATRRRKLISNQTAIKAKEAEIIRLEKADMDVAVETRQLDKLFEENANIRGDIEFYDRAVPSRVGIDAHEDLTLKPATLESVAALGASEGRKEVMGARRKEILAIAQRLDLSDADVRELVSGADIGRTETTYRNWLDNKFKPAAKEKFRRRITAQDVKRKQVEKQLEQEVNVRRQHKLPSVKKMTVEQMRDYMDILDTFERGDKVLSPRRVEALKTTPAAGARTMGEVNARVAELWGYPPDTVARMLPEPPIVPDILRGMERLASQSPVHKAVVSATESAIEAEDVAYMAERETLYKLGAKALASRKGMLKRILDPRMPEVVAHLEADAGQVYAGQVTLPDLTPAEQEFVDFVDEVYAKHYDYLQIVEGLKSRFEGKYYTHTERGFVEIINGIKDAGWRKTLKDLYQSSIPQALDFSVVNKATGKSVGLRAHMKQTMFRRGGIKAPSMNALAVVDGYLKAIHKKRALDKLVPWVDSVVDAAVWADKDVTEEGLTRKEAFDKFINHYLTQKKGGTILAESVWHNGFLDVAFRTLSALPSWAYIAFNVKLQTAAKIGEVIASIPVGGIGIADAWRLRLIAAVPERFRPELGTAVAGYLKANEGFTGTPILDLDAFLHGEFKGRFTEAGVPVNERAGMLMYGLLQQHRVDTMRDVLLALSTREEIMSGQISPDRLAEIKLLASRWIDVKGSKSVLGATSPGALWTQFKGWAIPIIGTTLEDHAALLKQVAGKGKMTELQKLEMRRLYTTWAVTGVVASFVAQSVDDDDDSWTAQFLRGALRELMSLTGGANPLLFFTVPAFAYLEQLGRAISMTLKGERYKSGPHEGEFKGPPALLRLVPGNRLLKQTGIIEDTKGGRR